MHTSQSRLAKIAAGDPSVSLNLIFKSLFGLRGSRKELVQPLDWEPEAPKPGELETMPLSQPQVSWMLIRRARVKNIDSRPRMDMIPSI